MSEADYYRRCLQKGFLKLDPNIRPAICRNKNLGRLEYDVYICLLHHLNKEEMRCNPSNELIAWELGYSYDEKTGRCRGDKIGKAIQRLKDEGWITYEKVGAIGTTQSYKFPMAEKYGYSGEKGNCYTGEIYKQIKEADRKPKGPAPVDMWDVTEGYGGQFTLNGVLSTTLNGVAKYMNSNMNI